MPDSLSLTRRAVLIITEAIGLGGTSTAQPDEGYGAGGYGTVPYGVSGDTEPTRKRRIGTAARSSSRRRRIGTVVNSDSRSDSDDSDAFCDAFGPMNALTQETRPIH